MLRNTIGLYAIRSQFNIPPLTGIRACQALLIIRMGSKLSV
jgi:hypothetical protein